MDLSQAPALRILEDEHEHVRELVDRLGPDDFVRPATIGGGNWSAKDLVGHLTSWKEHALESRPGDEASRLPSSVPFAFRGSTA